MPEPRALSVLHQHKNHDKRLTELKEQAIVSILNAASNPSPSAGSRQEEATFL